MGVHVRVKSVSSCSSLQEHATAKDGAGPGPPAGAGAEEGGRAGPGEEEALKDAGKYGGKGGGEKEKRRELGTRARYLLISLLAVCTVASFVPPHLGTRRGGRGAERAPVPSSPAGLGASDFASVGGPDPLFFATKHGGSARRGKGRAAKEGPRRGGRPLALGDVAALCGHDRLAEAAAAEEEEARAEKPHRAEMGQGGGGPGPGPKQRIALYTGAYNHIRDGVALTLNRMVKYLLAHGHQVLILAPSTDAPVIQHEGTLIEVPSFPAPGRPEYRVSYKLTAEIKEKLREFQPTIMHVATPDYIGGHAQEWALKHRIPVACSYHTRFNSYLSYYHLGLVEPLLWQWMETFYNRCNHTYVPSFGIRDELVEHGVKQEVLMWTRGVDTALFGPEHRCPEWRAKLGFGSAPVVIMVCRLVWEKGLDKFAQVVQALERAGLAHHSVVVGDGPARKELEAMLPHTAFLGTLAGAALACAYASADVYVFPSYTETFGVTSLEAMASGLPVVTANASGPAMLVDHGVNGFMADPLNATEFLEHTRRLVEDEPLRRRMGAAGARIARERFHWAQVFEGLVRHYDALVPAPPERRALDEGEVWRGWPDHGPGRAKKKGVS